MLKKLSNSIDYIFSFKSFPLKSSPISIKLIFQKKYLQLRGGSFFEDQKHMLSQTNPTKRFNIHAIILCQLWYPLYADILRFRKSQGSIFFLNYNLFLRYQIMGSQMSGICGSDPFQRLRKKYDQQLIKLVITEKMKGVVRARFEVARKDIEEMFKNGKVTVNDLGNQKVNLIAKFIEQLRNQIDKLLPGGIREVEKQGGQSIQEISGVDKMKATVSSIRKKALAQLQTQRQIAIQKLKQKKTSFLQKLQILIPKLTGYNKLKSKIKKQILAKGEEAFASQIEAKEYEVKKDIENEMKLEATKDLINQIIPKNELNQATEIIPTNSQNTAITSLQSLMKVMSSSQSDTEEIRRLIQLFQEEATINYPLTDADFEESKESQFKTVPYIETNFKVNVDMKPEIQYNSLLVKVIPPDLQIDIYKVQAEINPPLVFSGKNLNQLCCV